MFQNIKTFLLSRPLIRFYRITGFGIFSVILISILDLIPVLNLSDSISTGLILILTSLIAALDKYIRTIKSELY